MKILAIMGSPRKKDTYKITQLLEKKLRELGDIDFEYLFLKDANLEMCRGCYTCLARGEDNCPLKDDRTIIESKILSSDGVLLVSPTYVANVSGLMKNFIDRFAYICHRPKFYMQNAILITTEGSSGAKYTIRNLFITSMTWGFNVVANLRATVNPYTSKFILNEDKVLKNIEKQAKRFYKKTIQKKYESPNIFALMSFKLRQKTFTKPYEGATDTDYLYWKNKGWLDRKTKYFCDIKVSIFKRMGAYFLYRIFSPFL